MRKETEPTRTGLYRLVGRRKLSRSNNHHEDVDEVVLVKSFRNNQGQIDLTVSRFGRMGTVHWVMFTGDWYFIGDEIERITSNTGAAPAVLG